MELPKTLEHCHQMIRDLMEENEVLRQSGADFGHLAERLNSALREERQRAGDVQFTTSATRPDVRRTRATSVMDETKRWSMAVTGQSTGPDATSTVPGRQAQMDSKPRRPRTLKWVV
jgi:hypothetical protein